MCYLAKGDIALSVGMTAVSTMLAPLIIPLLVLLLSGENIEVNPYAIYPMAAVPGAIFSACTTFQEVLLQVSSRKSLLANELILCPTLVNTYDRPLS